jgi:hypothetical protein
MFSGISTALEPLRTAPAGCRLQRTAALNDESRPAAAPYISSIRRAGVAEA